MKVKIRLASPSDKQSLLELVTRLSDFELQEWRNAEMVDTANQAYIAEALAEDDPGSAIYVAEDDTSGKIAGFIRLQTQTDFFSKEQVGYIPNLAVDRAYEGQGIGRMLLDAAEKWALDNGFTELGLHVFVENRRARRIYQEYGFQDDHLKCVKFLRPKS